MAANYLLLGEPDWYGALVYLFIFLASAGGFVFTVIIIYTKVFGRARALTINPDAEEAHGDERG